MYTSAFKIRKVQISEKVQRLGWNFTIGRSEVTQWTRFQRTVRWTNMSSFQTTGCHDRQLQGKHRHGSPMGHWKPLRSLRIRHLQDNDCRIYSFTVRAWNKRLGSLTTFFTSSGNITSRIHSGWFRKHVIGYFWILAFSSHWWMLQLQFFSPLQVENPQPGEDEVAVEGSFFEIASESISMISKDL